MALFASIPIARQMGIEMVEYANGRIELSAPLEPNLNDKGTGFAGSIASLLTLAGWGLVTLVLRENGIEADVMVVESGTTYSAPVYSSMQAFARMTPEAIEDLLLQIRETGKAHVHIESRLESDGQSCATMAASFAVVHRE